MTKIPAQLQREIDAALAQPSGSSRERLSFAKMEQDTKMSLLPILAIVRTVNEPLY